MCPVMMSTVTSRAVTRLSRRPERSVAEDGTGIRWNRN